MVDYRDFAIELTEEMGFSEKDMLVAALKWMSLDDVKGMLEANEYPMSCEEDEEVEADLLARYPNAIELTEDMGYSAEQMLVACLKYMSQDDVKDMLEANEYPMSCEEDEEVEADLLARYPDAIAQVEVLKSDYLGGSV